MTALKLMVALVSCPTCGRAVGVFQNQTFLCRCGRGTLYPVKENKIVWLAEDEASLKLYFAGNMTQYGTAALLTREAI